MTQRTGGVAGTHKQLIFAPLGLKPDIIITDVINIDLEIAKHSDHFLMYDRPISAGKGRSAARRVSMLAVSLARYAKPREHRAHSPHHTRSP